MCHKYLWCKINVLAHATCWHILVTFPRCALVKINARKLQFEHFYPSLYGMFLLLLHSEIIFQTVYWIFLKNLVLLPQAAFSMHLYCCNELQKEHLRSISISIVCILYTYDFLFGFLFFCGLFFSLMDMIK